MFIRSDNGENNGDSVGINELALPDSEWISPPASISSGSSESGATFADASLADSFSCLDVTEPITGGEEKGDYSQSSESSVAESRPEEAHSGDKQESSGVHLIGKDEESVINQDKAEEELQKTSTHEEPVGQLHTGQLGIEGSKPVGILSWGQRAKIAMEEPQLQGQVEGTND